MVMSYHGRKIFLKINTPTKNKSKLTFRGYINHHDPSKKNLHKIGFVLGDTSDGYKIR